VRSELARLCLPEAARDPDRLLAWTNSLCLLFLAIGLCGARRGLVDVRPVPPLEEPVPVVTEPVVVPPQEATEAKPTTQDTAAEPAPVAVVVPALPNLSFSVPTIGRLVTDAALATAPPPEPAAVYARVLALNNTGDRGDRPQPPYPPLARDQAEQGTVILRLTADAAGNVVTAEVKSSSGYPILDHATVEFVKRHWHLPTGQAANQVFETTFNYRLESE
jgi:protein TonB